MQESFHTISPITSPMDQMKSKRNIVIALVIIVIAALGVAVWYTLYQKNNRPLSGDSLTPEQKQAIVADMKSRGLIPEPTLTPQEKQEIVKAQSKAVATAPTLTPEEKAEIIRQMNLR